MKEFKLCLDYGHGGRDGGGSYKSRKESMDNLRLGKLLRDYLSANGIRVYETRSLDIYISLEDRVKLSNRQECRLFISLHRNIFRPELARGVEVHIHPTTNDKNRFLAKEILAGLEGVGFKNRGVKEANFYVLNKTKAPAILLEIGFLDNGLDNSLFDGHLGEIAEGIGREILKTSDLL